jgi:hypothetical protein
MDLSLVTVKAFHSKWQGWGPPTVLSLDAGRWNVHGRLYKYLSRGRIILSLTVTATNSPALCCQSNVFEDYRMSSHICFRVRPRLLCCYHHRHYHHTWRKALKELIVAQLAKGCPVFYGSGSQPLWDRGPVNSFFIRRGPGPNKFTRKYLSNFI